MKKLLIVFPMILLLTLSACTYSEGDAFEEMLSRLPGVFDAVTQAAPNETGFQKLYRSYAEYNAVNFVNAEKEMNNILNTKYSYGVSAYNQSNGICDTASMFFGDESAERLGIYFKLLGYSKREYSENGNSASFTCEKDESTYKYEISYDENESSFEITLYKNDAVCEAFRCSVSDGGVNKTYYDGNIKRLIVSSADAEKNVDIAWYDTEYTDGFDVTETEPAGFIKYNNGILSGN